MIRITLRQLAVFEAVAREGSIVKAAGEIGLSPSAASMSLKDLEAQLGAQLFVRQGKRLMLSDRGRQVREMATSILLQVVDLGSLTAPQELSGRLRIGAAGSLGNYLLPQLCAGFMQQYPRISIELRVSSSMDVMERVQRMSLDLGFVGAPVNSTYLQASPWLRDSLVVCCAPDNPLASRPRIMLNELARQPWVLEKTASSERTAFTTEALKYVNSINVVLETDSIEAIKRVVRQGQAVACISALAVEDEVRRGELAILKIPELNFTRICSLITRRNVYYSQTLQAFRTFAMAQGASTLTGPDERPSAEDIAKPC
jgi:DNA-binding transcriptional LysR family regulator